ncbi:MAG: hypothetical protein ACOYN2_03215 [Patescibacteria group bacterium]
MRIQGTSWYRDFLSGKLDRETFERDLLTANSIEQILLGDSEILPKIQYQDWWKKYLRGDIDPSTALNGNIRAFVQIEKFQKQNPETYARITKNPRWINASSNPQDPDLISQGEAIETVVGNVKNIEANSQMKERLAAY